MCYDEFSFAYCGIKDLIAWNPEPNIFTPGHAILTIVHNIKKSLQQNKAMISSLALFSFV